MCSGDGQFADKRPARTLTEREQTILGLIAHGKRNREISEELDITERTVKFHVSGLARLAIERGLVQL